MAGLKIPAPVVKELEDTFEKLLKQPLKKLDEDFERLLNKKTKPKPETKTWPGRIVPLPNTDEVQLAREDGTRVIKFSDAMEAVWRVLMNQPDWGPRFTKGQDTQSKAEAVWDYLNEAATFMTQGDTTVESKLTKIAKLMKLRLLRQDKKRKMVDVTAYIRI